MKTIRNIREEMTTGGVAGIGSPAPEGKPSNWSEPGVSIRAQKRHRQENEDKSERRTIIIDMLRRAFPKMVGQR